MCCSIHKKHFLSRIKTFPSLITTLQNRGLQNPHIIPDEELFSQLKSNMLDQSIKMFLKKKNIKRCLKQHLGKIYKAANKLLPLQSLLTLKSNAEEFYLISQKNEGF